MSQDDPRVRGLFGACYLVGYGARLFGSSSAPSAATFGQVVGHRGVAAVGCGHGGGSGSEADGLLHPAFHVLRGFARGSARSGNVVTSTSTWAHDKALQEEQEHEEGHGVAGAPVGHHAPHVSHDMLLWQDPPVRVLAFTDSEAGSGCEVWLASTCTDTHTVQVSVPISWADLDGTHTVSRDSTPCHCCCCRRRRIRTFGACVSSAKSRWCVFLRRDKSHQTNCIQNHVVLGWVWLGAGGSGSAARQHTHSGVARVWHLDCASWLLASQSQILTPRPFFPKWRKIWI